MFNFFANEEVSNSVYTPRALATLSDVLRAV